MHDFSFWFGLKFNVLLDINHLCCCIWVSVLIYGAYSLCRNCPLYWHTNNHLSHWVFVLDKSSNFLRISVWCKALEISSIVKLIEWDLQKGNRGYNTKICACSNGLSIKELPSALQLYLITAINVLTQVSDLLGCETGSKSYVHFVNKRHSIKTYQKKNTQTTSFWTTGLPYKLGHS